jgi:hypothetical protein
METKKAKNKQRRLSFVYILGGGLLKEDFFSRHIKKIGFAVILTLLFIGNRYYCLIKMREIAYLQQELSEIKLEALAVSVELSEYSRHSMVEELVKKQQINLEGAKTPPYELYK